MDRRLGWGIIGTGNIAGQFAGGMVGSRRGRVAAVGSRREESAQGFAAAHGIAAAYGSYEAVLADSSVEAVYVSLPNSLHHEWTIKALRAGKHVLCEKPLAVTSAQAQEMVDVAQQTGRVLVEAFMYRTHPLTLHWLEQFRAGAIGKLKMVRASFCFCTTKVAGNVRFDAALAGGALLDVGCYCVNLARLLAQVEPVEVHACAQLHATGVDEMVVAALRFPSGVLASFTCGMMLHADNSASICGDQGYLHIPVPWKPPVQGAQYTLARSTPPRMDGGNAPAPPPRQTFTVDAEVPLYALEADAFAATVLDHAPPAVTCADSLGNMRVLDELRRQIGAG